MVLSRSLFGGFLLGFSFSGGTGRRLGGRTSLSERFFERAVGAGFALLFELRSRVRFACDVFSDFPA